MAKQVCLPLFSVLNVIELLALICLKDVSVLRIVQKLLDIFWKVKMDVDRGLIYNEITHIHQILFWITIFFHLINNNIIKVNIFKGRLFIKPPQGFELSLCRFKRNELSINFVLCLAKLLMVLLFWLWYSMGAPYTSFSKILRTFNILSKIFFTIMILFYYAIDIMLRYGWNKIMLLAIKTTSFFWLRVILSKSNILVLVERSSTTFLYFSYIFHELLSTISLMNFILIY